MKNGAEKSETAYRELSSTITLSFYLSDIREIAVLWQVLEAGKIQIACGCMSSSVHVYRSCTVAIFCEKGNPFTDQRRNPKT